MLEGGKATEKTQLHLDRCLTCRSCETTCPSGVKYGRLLDIGRHVVDKQVGRSASARAGRFAILDGLLSGPLFGAALMAGRMLKTVPAEGLALRDSGPPRRRVAGPRRVIRAG